MLFIIAEKEELFDNRDHGIKAHELAKGPKKLVTIPKITHYGIYKEARAAGPEAGHRVVRHAPQGRPVTTAGEARALADSTPPSGIQGES